MPPEAEEGEIPAEEESSGASRTSENEDTSSVEGQVAGMPAREPTQNERCFIEWFKDVPGTVFPDGVYLKIIDVSALGC